MAESHDTIPVGFCQCGCGQKTPPAKQTIRKRGWKKGEPLPYSQGHSGRWAEERKLAQEAEAVGLLLCRGCKAAKPREAFFNRLKRHGTRCRNCAAEQMRRWKRSDPEAARRSLRKANLKANYGITPEAYDRMSDEQGGVCAICRRGETRLNRRGEPKMLCVDHSHVDGRVRGLLCHKCNNALGCLQDSVELFEAAISYLRKYQ